MSAVSIQLLIFMNSILRDVELGKTVFPEFTFDTNPAKNFIHTRLLDITDGVFSSFSGDRDREKREQEEALWKKREDERKELERIAQLILEAELELHETNPTIH